MYQQQMCYNRVTVGRINFELDENYHREGKTCDIFQAGRSNRPEIKKNMWDLQLIPQKITCKCPQIAEISHL